MSYLTYRAIFFKVILCLLFIHTSVASAKPQTIKVKSPDNSKVLLIHPEGEKGITFSLLYGKEEVVLPSTLTLKSKDIDFTSPFKVVNVVKEKVKNEWVNPIGERSTVTDHYTQVKIELQSKTSSLNLICRAYNEGVAFAYEIPQQNGLSFINIEDENITYRFKKDHQVWSTPKRESGKLTAQGEYQKIALSQLEVGCERPLLIEVDYDKKLVLAEAKLVDYARLSFQAGKKGAFEIVSSLDGRQEDIKQDKITGAVIEGESSNAPKVKGKLPLQSPWRVMMMAENYGELLENNFIIENLNDPCAIKDPSWVTPGKVLREGTLTNQGALASIDFVASHNMQYVHFDAGWYGNEMDNASDATTITLDPKRSKGPFDLEKICQYAKSKGIKVMLYVNRRALEKQLDDLLPLFSKWGVAGIKFGFVRVGDQEATAWMHEAIKKASEYKMIVDVHDEYRPTGFSRTYPNLLTQEGIRGDEETVPNQHTLITMFTRCLAGASDNTVCYYNKRVKTMGSNASQLAKTVCIYSPLQFLYWYDSAPLSPMKDDALWGNTKHIGNEPELEFFNNVPTVWDETKVLKAEIGKIGVIARRKGNNWFVGGINGMEPQVIALDFSFLNKKKEYTVKIYTDDDTMKTRTKVKIQQQKLTYDQILNLKIKPNNGFVLHITQDKLL
ncbi:glycoside hydrolase family 97 protein [Flammeovirga aprica]|uniref:Glycoside hydrolase family 97 protein n=1 Tax=Flammeovirga aprica JL-4 TaxID=694437 RepID=A0A7X9RU74_9BACT|nr:glycoside hydrolase family 97 protein [Flammeovirga aprica]NME68795.1 glycoside hydrolase family 97 protein [Flammeovirga aprica JL-4]